MTQEKKDRTIGEILKDNVPFSRPWLFDGDLHEAIAEEWRKQERDRGQAPGKREEALEKEG